MCGLQFIVLDSVVQGEALARLQATAARWHAALPTGLSGGPKPVPQLPPPMEAFRHPADHPQFVSRTQYGDTRFAELAVNP